MLDAFKALVAESSVLSAFIDMPFTTEGPEGSEWTIAYLFDGYMDCAVIFDGSRYYDLQDINVEEKIWECDGGDWRKFSHYPSLDGLINHMEEVLT